MGSMPMPHISQSIRDFPTPINKTNMRSFMALAQQVSYATAVAPRLLPFRELLKDKVPWFWDRSMDEVFTHTKNLLADKVEEGIKSYDPARVTALLTECCHHGVGFVMMQKHCHCPAKQDGTTDLLCCSTGWLVCMVGSRFTHTAEANYSATEGELLAQADALQKTKYFTLGCPQLILGTDHMPPVSPTCPQSPQSYLPTPSNTSAATTSPFTATTLGSWWTGSAAGSTSTRAEVGPPAWWT